MEDPVEPGAILGTWSYYTLRGEEAEVRFDTDGTFEQTLFLNTGTMTVAGTWALEGSSLRLEGFHDSAWPSRSRETQFYVTDWYTKEPAPFGGEGDQDHWQIWNRIDDAT